MSPALRFLQALPHLGPVVPIYFLAFLSLLQANNPFHVPVSASEDGPGFQFLQKNNNKNSNSNNSYQRQDIVKAALGKVWQFVPDNRVIMNGV